MLKKTAQAFPFKMVWALGCWSRRKVSFAGKTAKGNDVLAQYLICYMCSFNLILKYFLHLFTWLELFYLCSLPNGRVFCAKVIGQENIFTGFCQIWKSQKLGNSHLWRLQHIAQWWCHMGVTLLLGSRSYWQWVRPLQCHQLGLHARNESAQKIPKVRCRDALSIWFF